MISGSTGQHWTPVHQLPFPVHGYDTADGLSKSAAPKGMTRKSLLMGDQASPPEPSST